MPPKRRRSSVSEYGILLPTSKRTRAEPFDRLSQLSDELLIRILHHIPISSLLQCQRLSHKFYTLAGDSQIWKNLYYNRFVLPRALRIPGIRAAQPEEVLNFSSKRSKWLDDNTLVDRLDGKKTNWKSQYKLRYNWSIGACQVQEIHVADRPSIPSMLVKLAEGVVLTADKEAGLRAWDLKCKEIIAKCELEGDIVPTCIAVDEQEPRSEGLGVAVGFFSGGWGTWTLDTARKTFCQVYKHPPSSNGMLSAIAFANPYVLTITDAQLLSLYTFSGRPLIPEGGEIVATDSIQEAEVPSMQSKQSSPPSSNLSSIDSPIQPHLLASLKSQTSWPPLSLSIRTTSSTIIASIAYSLPTYLSGYTVGLQELHLSHTTGTVTFSRLASALPQGFSSILPSMPSSPSSSGTNTPGSHQSHPHHHSGSSTCPTSLSYSHPYILATHPDNTLTLYLCTSTSDTLIITSGTKLWGHTSSVSSAEITSRGKAVSVSTRGNELRVWELEGGLNPGPSISRKRVTKLNRLSEMSVQIRAETRLDARSEDEGVGPDWDRGEEIEARKQWVGFDDEMVIVLKESGRGTQALMVYDFT
jgi:hypothetical protein